MNTHTANVALKQIYSFMEEKKAQEMKMFAFTQSHEYHYAILSTGLSSTHIKHLAHHITKFMPSLNYKVINKGSINEESGWIILDYIDIMIHLFTHEKREFYNVDDLYSKTCKEEINFV